MLSLRFLQVNDARRHGARRAPTFVIEFERPAWNAFRSGKCNNSARQQNPADLRDLRGNTLARSRRRFAMWTQAKQMHPVSFVLAAALCSLAAILLTSSDRLVHASGQSAEIPTP